MVEVELLGLSQAGDTPFPLVLLRYENRVLPILVGPAEAHAIQSGMLSEKTPRPMTHDLICNVLVGLGGKVQSVNIYQLENDTFYAYLNVEQHNKDGQVERVLRIDTRPSDGIAIAVRVGCPIFAAEEVIDTASKDISILQTEDDEDDDYDPNDTDTDDPGDADTD